MKIAVCIKHTLDPSVPLRVVHGRIEQDSPWPVTCVAPAERAALEKALQLCGEVGGTVTAISAGGPEAPAALRFAMAAGAHRAVHVRCPDSLDPVASARAVAALLAADPPDLVLCGTQSADGGSGLFPAWLAEERDWPLVTRVVDLRLPGGQWLEAERRLDRGGRERVRCPLPAVVGAEAALAQPRYVSAGALQRAAAAPLDDAAGAPAGEAPWKVLAIEPPKPRPKRVAAPDPRWSARERVAHLMSGGLQRKQGGSFVEGDPPAVAAEIVRFLEQRGFLGPRGGRNRA